MSSPAADSHLATRRGARGHDETRGAGPAAMADSPNLNDLRAEARYHRERYDLYRAKMYGARPTTMARLRELERAHHGAEAGLRRAQRESLNRD